MAELDDIEQAVSRLSAADFRKFRDWFEKLEAERFDERIERDANAGKLDGLADEAIEDSRAGRTREI